MKLYEFHIYGSDESGDVPASPVDVQTFPCMSEGAARGVARKLARKARGPVDVAISGRDPWNDRYVGTASPTYPHSTICRETTWERLD